MNQRQMAALGHQAKTYRAEQTQTLSEVLESMNLILDMCEQVEKEIGFASRVLSTRERLTSARQRAARLADQVQAEYYRRKGYIE